MGRFNFAIALLLSLLMQANPAKAGCNKSSLDRMKREWGKVVTVKEFSESDYLCFLSAATGVGAAITAPLCGFVFKTIIDYLDDLGGVYGPVDNTELLTKLATRSTYRLGNDLAVKLLTYQCTAKQCCFFCSQCEWYVDMPNEHAIVVGFRDDPSPISGVYCGSELWQQHVLEAAEHIVGFPNINPDSCCREHDRCYDSCSQDISRESCDRDFQDCLYDKCDRVYNTVIEAPSKATCRFGAEAYYFAVRRLGEDAYDKAQDKCPKNCVWTTWLEECDFEAGTLVRRGSRASFQETMNELGHSSPSEILLAADVDTSGTWIGYFGQRSATWRWNTVVSGWDDFQSIYRKQYTDGYTAEALTYRDGTYLAYFSKDPIGSSQNSYFGMTRESLHAALDEKINQGFHMTAGLFLDGGYCFAWFRKKNGPSRWSHVYSIDDLHTTLNDFLDSGYHVTAVVHGKNDGWLLWGEERDGASAWATRSSTKAIYDHVTENWEGKCPSVITYGCESNYSPPKYQSVNEATPRPRPRPTPKPTPSPPPTTPDPSHHLWDAYDGYACRVQGSDSGEKGVDFEKYEGDHVDLGWCMSRCEVLSYCKGFEYRHDIEEGIGKCEIWLRYYGNVERRVAPNYFFCYWKKSNTSWKKHSDTACGFGGFGVENRDFLKWYDVSRDWCKNSCLELGGSCHGYDYHYDRERCRVFYRETTHNVAKDGIDCWLKPNTPISTNRVGDCAPRGERSQQCGAGPSQPASCCEPERDCEGKRCK